MDCVFGGDDFGNNGARAYAKAAVPGGRGRVTGAVLHTNEYLNVVPGPTQPNPDAARPAPTTPASPTPQAAARPPGSRPTTLADTGVSVAELSALALLLILTGGALLLVRRDPRTR